MVGSPLIEAGEIEVAINVIRRVRKLAFDNGALTFMEVGHKLNVTHMAHYPKLSDLEKHGKTIFGTVIYAFLNNEKFKDRLNYSFFLCPPKELMLLVQDMAKPADKRENFQFYLESTKGSRTIYKVEAMRWAWTGDLGLSLKRATSGKTHSCLVCLVNSMAIVRDTKN